MAAIETRTPEPDPDRNPSPQSSGATRPAAPALTAGSRIGRRSLLAVGGTAVLLLTAGCNPFSTTRVTQTEVVTAPPPIDPIDQLIAKTRLHYLRLVASVQLGGTAATELTPLRDDRLAHLQALLADQARTTGQRAAPATSAGQSVAAPAGVDAVLKLAVSDAQDAQIAFSDALGTVSRYRAMLFASIAASLAGHQEALS